MNKEAELEEDEKNLSQLIKGNPPQSDYFTIEEDLLKLGVMDLVEVKQRQNFYLQWLVNLTICPKLTKKRTILVLKTILTSWLIK